MSVNAERDVVMRDSPASNRLNRDRIGLSTQSHPIFPVIQPIL